MRRKRIAKALDAITRTEYTEARKIRIAGADFAFKPEQEILPEDLDVEVDYVFQPGSMLSRQKEAVKNELLTLKDAGLVDDYTVRKVLSSAVPDAFRQGYGMQEACARRQLQPAQQAAAAAEPLAVGRPGGVPRRERGIAARDERASS